MSALPITPTSYAHELREARFEPMHAQRLSQVMEVEQSVYAWPWSEGNMTDSIQAGHLCLQLMGGPSALLGYMVAMPGVEEVHLLNITVARPYLRQGWARVMLDALALWARQRHAQWLWLEVRAGNQRAISVYEAFGFRRVGERKRYYPAQGSVREDAIIMSYRL